MLAAYRNPVSIVTKSGLVSRDCDLLAQLAEDRAALVCLSLTTLNAELARRLEPRASTPTRRLAAITALAEAGIPVGVMIAPIIPGLTDHEIPALLTAAAQAGAARMSALPAIPSCGCRMAWPNSSASGWKTTIPSGKTPS